MKNIRVRFAPSPTGKLHIGNLRTAIFNWLFARHNNGKFLIRIEDTDLERSTKENTDGILDVLNWMEMTSDEPVVIQTSLIKQHHALVQKLLEEGKAYKCFCSQEHLEAQRKELEEKGEFFKYPGTCKNLSEKEKEANSNKPFVVRFKLPEQEVIEFNDLIKGTVSFDMNQFDDFIIVRSDGSLTYNFVVVHDDILMKISHIIRGEDHLINTPKQIFLYQAAGATPPYFAHLPMILGASGQKLSKRDATTAVLDYRKKGFLSGALLNYLVRLGWSHGDQEIFTKDELIKFFELEHVGKKASIFDTAKLEWVNSVYIKAMSAEDLLNNIIWFVDSEFESKTVSLSKQQLLDLLNLYKERVNTLSELANLIVLASVPPVVYDQESVKKWCLKSTLSVLQKLEEELLNISDFSKDNLQAMVKTLSKSLDLKMGNVAQPIRIALIGSDSGPGVFDMLDLFGKKISLQRLKLFYEFLEKYNFE
ncbi:MAG: Glutamate-tRNA ligase [candidate division TM6 bacterium GW2011_GWF2_32_72]|nr:MAG: Glutamate-tRNA ligase [candidate division TM6 bacterium GW2011_GWF2_32_72]